MHAIGESGGIERGGPGAVGRDDHAGKRRAVDQQRHRLSDRVGGAGDGDVVRDLGGA